MDSSLEVNPEATRLAPSLSQVPPPTELNNTSVVSIVIPSIVAVRTFQTVWDRDVDKKFLPNYFP